MENPGSTITLHGVSYTFRVKKQRCRSVEKTILHDISGIFTPGLTAIMGPTGCGKSSLLDVIAGRKDPIGISGRVLVDGKKQPDNFKCMTGYVVQDDIMTGTLTVKENIAFSANLRLPSDTTKEAKESKVKEILEELDLENCANSMVGTQLIRGVSGGERKRTSIGMELVTEPSVLFLDEPTTGLDASTAHSVMSLLQSLSSKNRTIICSIHQPRYSIFKQFDQLVLLTSGRVVYHGAASEALNYFKHLGYVCEPHNNPADFFLDILHEHEHASTSINHLGDTITQGSKVVTEFSLANPVQFNAEKGHRKSEAITQLVNQYLESTQHKMVQKAISTISKEYEQRRNRGKESNRDRDEYAVSMFQQVKVLSTRALKNMKRNMQTLYMQLLTHVMLGLCAGLIYLQMDNDIQSGIQNRVGAFFLITNNIVFTSNSAIALFSAERPNFIHESVSGFYRVSAYFICKLLFDSIPMRILPTTVYTVIVYFLTGLRLEVTKFFVFYVTVCLCSLSAVSIAIFCSCLSPVFAIANLICIMFTMLMMIFGGLLVNIDTLGSWLSWLQYLSIFRYANKALYINELKGMTFCEKNEFGNGTYCDDTLALEYLEDQGIAYETAWDLWQNHLAMFCIGIVFFTLSYIALRRINKYRESS